MQIVSLNAWGGQLWESFAPWIETTTPDVLCLQEVTRAPVPSPDWLHYRDAHRALDQRADLFGDVCRLLPDHQSFFAPAMRGTLQNAGGEDVVSEHGLGLWVRRDLAVTQVLHDFVHGSYRSDGWGAEPVPRAMQVARLEDARTGRQMIVGHFHGLRDPAGKHDTPAREVQSARAVEVFSRLWSPSVSGVLAGDFNLLPESRCLARLVEQGLTNLIDHHGITDTRTNHYTKPERFADYMLVSPDLVGADFAAPAEPAVSDHRALILTI